MHREPIAPAGNDSGPPMVAVDTVGAGYAETVLVVSGSSARMTSSTKDSPVDAAIVGIVDTVTMDTPADGKKGTA